MKFRLSSEFGELHPVRNWRPHTGIDLAMPEGTTLRSIGSGVVEQVFNGEGSLGKGVAIRLSDGSKAIYGHMSEVKTQVGERVNEGSLIGLSGNTGNSSGPHLHFGLKDAEGDFVDPTPIAEQLANLQGPVTKLMLGGAESIREKSADVVSEMLLGALDAVSELLMSFTLVGSAVLILLKVAGWRDGGRWAGVLIVANVLLKALFGGI